MILVGLQGARKTSAVRALSPFPEAFGEVSLEKTDEQLAFLLRGKLVIELAEMRGIAGRDAESTKAWITRRTEEWREPYKRFTTRYHRRCVIVGTANRTELLDDDTGERRWLPLMAGKSDVESLERDRDQLWAEGAVRFYANGIEWQAAEALALAEHGKFKVSDPWRDAVLRWLRETPGSMLGETPSTTPRAETIFRTADVLRGACELGPDRQTKAHANRVAKVLYGLGYELASRTVDGERFSAWRKK